MKKTLLILVLILIATSAKAGLLGTVAFFHGLGIDDKVEQLRKEMGVLEQRIAQLENRGKK